MWLAKLNQYYDNGGGPDVLIQKAYSSKELAVESVRKWLGLANEDRWLSYVSQLEWHRRNKHDNGGWAIYIEEVDCDVDFDGLDAYEVSRIADGCTY